MRVARRDHLQQDHQPGGDEYQSRGGGGHPCEKVTDLLLLPRALAMSFHSQGWRRGRCAELGARSAQRDLGGSDSDRSAPRPYGRSAKPPASAPAPIRRDQESWVARVVHGPRGGEHGARIHRVRRGRVEGDRVPHALCRRLIGPVNDARVLPGLDAVHPRTFIDRRFRAVAGLCVLRGDDLSLPRRRQEPGLGALFEHERRCRRGRCRDLLPGIAVEVGGVGPELRGWAVGALRAVRLVTWQLSTDVDRGRRCAARPDLAGVGEVERPVRRLDRVGPVVDGAVLGHRDPLVDRGTEGASPGVPHPG